MSQTLKINNFGANNVTAQTRLTDEVAAAVNSLPVINSADFGSGTFILIGAPGVNNTEIAVGTTPPDSTHLGLNANTKLNHNRNDPIAALFGDHIRIYSAVDQYGNGRQPDDANFSIVTTIAIDASQKLSSFTDAAGTVNTWYKYTYFNPTSMTETALAASKAVRADQGQNYCSLAQIRRAAGFTGAAYITDDLIDEFRQAAQAIVISTIGGLYQMPLPQPTNPVITQVTKDLAAGMLMVDQHQTMNPSRAKEGEQKIVNAQATLLELDTKVLVLRDAQFLETTVETGSGFGSNITDGDTNSDTVHTDYDAADNTVNDNPVFGVKDVY